MVVNNTEFKTKLNLLGLAISKNITSKMSERVILFDTENDTVYAYTCDGVNNIRVEIGKTNEDFYAIVDYSTFTNFIKSCEGDITLEPKDKYIYIKSSNVKCKLPTYNHEVARGNSGIPSPVKNYSYDTALNETIDLRIIKSILDPNHVVEIYRKIYFGDFIVVSDTDNVIKINKKVFSEDVLLDLSSVEILNAITNISYSFASAGKIKLLCVKSDELYATMVITNNDNNDFQYTDFIELFDTVNGHSIVLNTSDLSKAVNAGAMFKVAPNIVFNPKGIFARIDSVEYIYKISDVVCEDRTFELSSDLVKKLTALDKEITIYYTNSDLIKCETTDISEILSVTEVSNG